MTRTNQPPANGVTDVGGARGVRNALGKGASGQELSADRLASLLGERELNLRQVILRAHRAMNRLIAEKFRERGYSEIIPAHLTLLSNMDLGETSVLDLAERAQMTIEGMQQLAADLDRLGFLQLCDGNGPVATVTFTDAGWELMLTSFNLQREIESDCSARLQPGDLDQLRRTLRAMFRSV